MDHNKEESQTNRKVCFMPEVKMVLIKSRIDFSKKEKKRCWYSNSETQKMHKRCLRVSDRLESRDAKMQLSCTRGLEGLTTEGMESLSDAICACIDAVIEEQETQRSHGWNDQDRLAIVSQQVSKHSIDQAIERAMKDEKEARKIHRQDQQKLNPPAMPVRRISEDIALVCLEESFGTEEQEREIASMSVPKNFVVEDPVQSNNDSRSMHLDLSTCGKTRMDIGCHGRVVPMVGYSWHQQGKSGVI